MANLSIHFASGAARIESNRTAESIDPSEQSVAAALGGGPEREQEQEEEQLWAVGSLFGESGPGGGTSPGLIELHWSTHAGQPVHLATPELGGDILVANLDSNFARMQTSEQRRWPSWEFQTNIRPLEGRARDRSPIVEVEQAALIKHGARLGSAPERSAAAAGRKR